MYCLTFSLNLNRFSPTSLWCTWLLMGLIHCRFSLLYAEDLSQVQEANASYLDRPEGVINQLRWSNLGIRRRMLRLNVKAALTRDETNALLQRTQLALFGGEGREVISDLRGELIRDQLNQDPSYPLLLITLAQAERQQGLKQSAKAHLEQALKVGVLSRNRFEETLIASLQYGQINPKQLPDLWKQYLALSQKAKRSPSEMVTYLFGKAYFLSDQIAQAKPLMSSLRNAGQFKLRSSFFLGLIALKNDALEEAEEEFSKLDQVIKKIQRISNLSRQNPAANESKYQFIKKHSFFSLGSPTPGSVTIECIPDPKSENEQCPSTFNHSSTQQELEASLKKEFGNLLTPELFETLIRAEQEILADQQNRGLIQANSKVELPNKESSVLNHIASALHITRARLALKRGEYEQAWQLYRGVPLETAWSQEALLEGVYLLRLRGAYFHASNLLDQVIDPREFDAVSCNLLLWKIELLHKAGYDNKVAQIRDDLTLRLKRAHQAISTSDNEKILFPDEIKVWLDDHDQGVVERISNQLDYLRFEIEDAQQIFKQLLDVAQSGQIPSIEEVNVFTQSQNQSLSNLMARLPPLTEPWARWSKSRPSPILGLPTRQISTEQVKQSIFRLNKRLATLTVYSEQRAQSIKSQLPEWLTDIAKDIKIQKKKLNMLSQAIRLLHQRLKSIALQRVEAAQASLLLGPTDSIFWDKEQASDDLFKLFENRKRDLEPLKRLNAQADAHQKRYSVIEALSPFVESSPSIQTQQNLPKGVQESKPITSQTDLELEEVNEDLMLE